MIYQVSMYSQDPKWPHKHYRTGDLKKFSINNETITVTDLSFIKTIRENFDLVDFGEIEIKYFRHDYEPYPNFLEINVALIAVDLMAKEFLEEYKIEFKSKPLTILNEKNVSYELVMFPTKDLINFNASNTYITSRGTLATVGKDYFNPILSPLVLKPEARNIKGIFGLNMRGGLICDEITKNNLIESGLKCVAFEPLEIK